MKENDFLFIDRGNVPFIEEEANRKLAFPVSHTLTLGKLFRQLIQRGYFPQPACTKPVWVLLCHSADFYAWNTQKDIIFSRYIEEEPTILSAWGKKDALTIFFEYFPSEEERAKYLYQKYAGNRFHLYQDGFSDEFDSYAILQKQQDLWAK